MGIELAYHDINCPLFVEDIVLGKTEAEFQAILNITANFALSEISNLIQTNLN